MWSRQLFLVWILAVTVLATQSHVIHKRGLISKLFGGSSKSTKDIDANMSPRERSKLRELLKNPVVITMLSAAIGMVVQQALAAKNMDDVCENKYVKMAYMAGGVNPQIQQALNLLGCNGPNRKFGGDKNKSKDKYGVTTTPANRNAQGEDEDDDDNEGAADNQDDDQEENAGLQSGLPPEKQSKLTQLLSIARGEKGAKRNFVKGLFGLNKKDKTFKKGQKLPASTYTLDKDDANSLKDLENEIEKANKGIH
ncbi:unnamed protein product [Adineta ricciae]|uniref:Uncharacterized protein n=1 Tax=Adineta ricciae TaxID=249248 RepID=A0A813NME5_ADIRI|nr:unnamed protein product [Adineta ricciae]